VSHASTSSSNDDSSSREACYSVSGLLSDAHPTGGRGIGKCMTRCTYEKVIACLYDLNMCDDQVDKLVKNLQIIFDFDPNKTTDPKGHKREWARRKREELKQQGFSTYSDSHRKYKEKLKEQKKSI
jgi:hypothetical protein